MRSIVVIAALLHLFSIFVLGQSYLPDVGF
jgi:hypothetical protein